LHLTQGQIFKLRAFEHPSASDTDDVDPFSAVWLDDLCNLWEVGDEVRKVSSDDEGGEGVLGFKPVPPLLILSNIARQEQARHTADYQVMQQYLRDTGFLIRDASLNFRQKVF